MIWDLSRKSINIFEYKKDSFFRCSKIIVILGIFFISILIDFFFGFPKFSSTILAFLAIGYGFLNFFIDVLDRRNEIQLRFQATKIVLVVYCLFFWGSSLSFLSTRISAGLILLTHSNVKENLENQEIYYLSKDQETWALASPKLETNDIFGLLESIEQKTNCKPYARLIFGDYYLLNIAC